jgi:hypothetical protein
VKTKHLEALERAWHDEGIKPHWHRIQKERLKVDWPVLYRALTELLDGPT